MNLKYLPGRNILQFVEETIHLHKNFEFQRNK